MLIDAHTHTQKRGHACLVMGVHAVGIHPWEIEQPFNEQELLKKFQAVEKQAEGLFAIGECGLDRARVNLATIEDQLKVFEWHRELAFRIKKPLIVHCVRAYSDLLMILKTTASLTPFLVHDYTGSPQQTRELLKYPVYFSLGKNFIRHPELINSIPPERLLLETDDHTDFSIEKVYNEVALALKMDRDLLEKQVEANFLSFFSQTNDVSAPDFIHNFC